MSRRRALVLVFGALTVVFLGASVLTLALVRDELLDAVDSDLRSSTAGFVAASGALDLDVLAEIDVEVTRDALIVIDGRDEVVFVPAGSRPDPLPRPDLSASTIVARAGDPFTVDGVDGDIEYRVLSTELGASRYLAVAAPIDDLNEVLGTLGRSLLITLFAVIAVLGAVFWLMLRLSLRPYDHMIETAHAIAEGDLDRRVDPSSSEPMIEQLAESLNTMLDRIQASFADKEAAESRLRQFVADASHELRTPLTSISGYSELYLSGAATDDESVTQQMTRIDHEAARLTRLVNDLLTLARLDERRPPERVPVDLAALGRDAATDFAAAEPGTPLGTDIGGDGTAMVHGDRDALGQVMTNLLTNARAHTPDGTAVTLSVDADDDTAWFTVADDGPGMDVETAAHVFDRFYRADKSRTGTSANSGLGLSIVAAIVAAHDGTIGVETAPGRGAAFTVRLPRRRAERPGQHPGIPETAPATT